MRRLSVLALWLAGCTAGDPSAAVTAEPVLSEAEGLGAPTLVEISVAESHGLDQTPRRRVGFRGPDGSLEPLELAAIAFVPRFAGGAAIVDADHRVYHVRPGGDRRMLADHASGELAVSDDGRSLAYVVVRDVLGELRVHDGTREQTIASGLASIGMLRVLDDQIAFVGAANGGIAGVWTAPLDGTGARCITNCDLRTGTDWLPRFVPPPSDAEALEGVVQP